MADSPKRKPGRPRDATADRRILAAARAVAADVGIHGASMSAIADRSKTGKPTIYLRWADRRAVMVAAIVDLDGPVAEPAAASTREALTLALLDDRELLVAGPEARFLRSALFESATDGDICDALDGSILGPRRERLRRIAAKGARRGDLRPEVDPAACADLLLATIVRAMVLGGDGADPDEIEHHASLIANGSLAQAR